MNIKEFFDFSVRPKLYTDGSHQMWTDEYISGQLLRIHLDPDIDLASRRQATIEKTVDWIISKAGNSELRILDLGCGPGLYAARLAAQGHSVVGIDFSAESVRYARARGAEKGSKAPEYRNANYLKMDIEENAFDLVMMIYTDFGVLNPFQRSILLEKIRKCLKPGGIFIFDVLSDDNWKEKTVSPEWKCEQGGFWSGNAYLILSDSLMYEEDKVILYRHLVAGDSGSGKEEVKTYHFWTHFFSENDLTRILKEEGFPDLSFYRDVLPEDGEFSGDNVIFTVAKL